MRASRKTVLGACGLGLAALACGGLSALGCVGDTGVVAHPYGQSNGGVDDADAGYADAAPAPARLDADAAEAAACSPSSPGQGTPCSAEGSVCEYGSNYLVECDTLATCAHGKWEISVPDGGIASCRPAAPGACPPSRAEVPVGQACEPANLDCDYLGGRCECAQNLPRSPGWPATWKCPDPSMPGPLGFPTGCPPVRPPLGTACSYDYGRCDYGACDLQGASLQECQHGAWVEQAVDCACPAAIPREGAACSRYALVCEYGSSDLAICNTLATCSSGQWTLATPDAGAPCVSAPASECPDAGQPIQGTTCSPLGLDCDYGYLRCECNNGPAPQSEATWRCDSPALAGPGCGPRPRLGSPCMQQYLDCDYGSCEITGGGAVVCVDVWVSEGSSGAGCAPISLFGDGIAVCPAQPPAAGGMCFVGEAICEYGSNPVVGCNTIATCGSGPASNWAVVAPDSGDSTCVATPPGECPTSFAAVPRGAACTPSPSACDYPEGRCQCASTSGSSTAVWSCQDPAPGCPQPRPALGSACTEEEFLCTYDPCRPGGDAEMCLGGIWIEQAIDCTADAG